MTTMTIDELLAEVTRSYQGDEGLTGPEWAEKMGVCVITARKRIGILLKAGKMKRGKAPRTSELDERTWPRTVYRLV